MMACVSHVCVFAVIGSRLIRNRIGCVGYRWEVDDSVYVRYQSCFMCFGTLINAIPQTKISRTGL